MMNTILCILLGLYIVIDAAYLAWSSYGDERNLTIAKYSFAFMSGLTLLFGIHNYDRLLLGGTIALFMLPETIYRILSWMEYKHSDLYNRYFGRWQLFTRRRVDS